MWSLSEFVKNALESKLGSRIFTVPQITPVVALIKNTEQLIQKQVLQSYSEALKNIF